MENIIISGNYYDKYHSKNPMEKLIMRNFFYKFKKLLSSIKPHSILDIGCGEGYITKYIYEFYNGNCKIDGVDIDENIINMAKKRYKMINFFKSSLYELNSLDKSYDLVVLSEVLEHLDDPKEASDIVSKLSNKYVIITIPNEPLWRILNIFRLKYLRSFGNTPGHIQHFNKKSIVNLLKSKYKIIKIFQPMPFIQILCEVKKQ